jgi:hypothetical protein
MAETRPLEPTALPDGDAAVISVRNCDSGILKTDIAKLEFAP